MNPYVNTAEARSHKGSLALYSGDYKIAEKNFLSVVSPGADTPASNKITPKTRPIPKVFPILYLPVEVAARELDARLALAMHAAEVGFHVIIGQAWSFHGMWKEYPPGVILFKTLNSLDSINMDYAQGAGHIICAIDEEGIGRVLTEGIFKMNLDPVSVAIADRIFTQGKAHDDMIRAVYPNANTVITGNPRAELYGDKYFKNTPGIHLFCSKAGNINPAGRSYLTCVDTTLRLAGGTSPRRMAKMFRQSTRDELRSLPEFINMVREVSKDKNVVVRPHPVENQMLWHQIFKDDDVEVDISGSLRDWLRITDTMYCHPDCGTEHEAMLAGVKCHVFGKPLKTTEGLFSEGSACENIVSELIDFQLLPDAPPVAYLSQSHTHFQAASFHRRKFPATPLQEIIEKMKDIKSCAGLQSEFTVNHVTDNQYYIRA
jgi:surface carbohydrate biosynthesis protein